MLQTGRENSGFCEKYSRGAANVLIKPNLRGLGIFPEHRPCPALDGRSCPMYCRPDRECYFAAARREREKLEAQCGAKTRAGHSCRIRKMLGRKRCRLHGGLSTGPKTRDGKIRALEALARGRATLMAKCARQPEPVQPRPMDFPTGMP